MTKGFSITPLGGLGETGALNCMIYHTPESAFIVDCGVNFVDDNELPGCSLEVPDFRLLSKFKDRLKGIVLTHGHEDHVGGIPYLLKEVNCPLYATAFTRGILENKFEEFGLAASIHDMNYNVPFTLGDFEIDPVFVNHSIRDVAALLIKANGKSAFHCTDLKIDHAAPENRVTDLVRFKEIGLSGLDVLLLDSTNAVSKGWTRSESTVRAALIETCTKIKGRILACLFSSNAFRLQSLFECARLTGRKVALTGRSTKNYLSIARDLDCMDVQGIELYDVEDIDQFPDNEVMVITAGSQAEPRSVLSRLSRDMFRPFKIKRGDTLVMSSKMIPGNEGQVLEMLNRIALLGAHIITPHDGGIHASGHAKQDELREIIRLTKPRHFIPIHGEFRHLQEHALLATEEGLSDEQITIALNGETVQIDSEGVYKSDYSEVTPLLVSENPERYIEFEAIRRRKKLAWNGLVAVALSYSESTQKVESRFDLQTEGLFGGIQEAELHKALWFHLENFIQTLEPMSFERLNKTFKVEIRRFLKLNYGIKPEVTVLVLNT